MTAPTPLRKTIVPAVLRSAEKRPAFHAPANDNWPTIGARVRTWGVVALACMTVAVAAALSF